MWDQQAIDKWYQENLARGVSQSKLDTIVQQQQADYLVRQGMPAKELQTTPIGIRAQTQEVTQAGKYEPVAKDTAGQAKRKLILNQAAPVLKRVIGSAMAAPPGKTGWFKSQIGKLPGVAGGEAEYLRRDVEGFARLIASAFASEVGVATDKDVKRWMSIMPQPGDTHEERVRQSQKLIDQITSESESLGVEPPKEIIEAAKLLPGVSGEIPEGKPPTKTLEAQLGEGAWLPAGLGMAGKVAGPLGAGLMGGVGQYLKQQASKDQLEKGLATMTPLGQLLFPEARATRPEAESVLKTGGAMAATAFALDKILPFLKGGGPKARIGQARTAAAQEAQKTAGGASTSGIVKKLDRFFVDHPEAKAGKIKTMYEWLKKTPRISVDSLLRRTQTWNDAYKSGGGLKAGLGNKAYDIAAREGKVELARVAPQVAKETAKLKFLYQAPKKAGKALWTGLKASALWKLLSGAL